MCRPSVVVLLLVFAAVPAVRARGQPPPDPTDASPLDAKATARALHQARGAEPKELARAMRDAARTEYDVRVRRVAGGTDTPDALDEASRRLLDAELALAAGPAERRAAREQRWTQARAIEDFTRERVEAALKTFTPADYWAARGERLLAELRLVESLGSAGKSLPGAVPDPLGDPDFFPAKAVARDLFEAARTSPRVLARAAADAPLQEYAIRFQRIRGGTDTPDVTWQALLRRVEAVRTSGAGPADLLAALEGHWAAAWTIELLTRERVEAGVKMFTPADYYDTRAHRLEAETWLAEARSRPDKPLPLRGGLQAPLADADAPLETRDLARTKFEAVRAAVRQLAENRRDALLAVYAVRLQRVLGGTDLPDAVRDDSRRLLAVELALAGGRAERLAALERHWARARHLEGTTRERVEAGVKTFTLADYYATRFDRLQAELWLAQARAAGE